jgi:hypothetical protein
MFISVVGTSFLLYLPLATSIFFSKKIDAAQAHFRSCYAFLVGACNEHLKCLSVSSIGPKVCITGAKKNVWGQQQDVPGLHQTHLVWANGLLGKKKQTILLYFHTMCNKDMLVI